MNPETPREELEIRLTAMLMGELSPEESAALQAQMADDPDLAALHERLRHAMEFLREAIAIPEENPVPVPLRLSNERRERLMACFKGDKQAPAAVILRPRWKSAAPLALAASIVVLLGTGLLWVNDQSHEAASRALSSMIGQIRPRTYAADTGAQHTWAAQAGAIRTRDSEKSGELEQKFDSPQIPQNFGFSSGGLAPAPPTAAAPELAASSNSLFSTSDAPGLQSPAAPAPMPSEPSALAALDPASRGDLDASGVSADRYAFNKPSPTAGTAIRVLPASASESPDRDVKLSESSQNLGLPAIVTRKMEAPAGNARGLETAVAGTLALSDSAAKNRGFGGFVGGSERPASGSIDIGAGFSPSQTAAGVPGSRARSKAGSLETAPLAGNIDALAEGFGTAVQPQAGRPSDVARVSKKSIDDHESAGSTAIESSRFSLAPVPQVDSELSSVGQSAKDAKVAVRTYQLAGGDPMSVEKKLNESLAYGLSDPVSTAGKAQPASIPWLYVYKDGSIGKSSRGTAENPIVGRTAFWTDDQSSKLNINTASEGTFWDSSSAQNQPKPSGETSALIAGLDKNSSEHEAALPQSIALLKEGLRGEAQASFGEAKSEDSLGRKQEAPGQEAHNLYFRQSGAAEEKGKALDAPASPIAPAAKPQAGFGRGGSRKEEEIRRLVQLQRDSDPALVLSKAMKAPAKPAAATQGGDTAVYVKDLQDKLSKAQTSLAEAEELRATFEKQKQDAKEKPAAAKPAEVTAKLDAKVIEDAAPAPIPKPALEPQPEIQTSANAFSTFSLNVSDVAFKLAGASLEKGQMPEPSTVRSEEFINAFDFRDPEPAPGAPLAFVSERARYPFVQNRDLLRLSVKTAAAGRQPGRSLNLVLLLDNSGSMERADRVQILHEALRILAAQLQPQDRFSVITFARTPRLWIDGLAGNQAGEAVARVGEVTPQGGTNLAAALDLGYQTALRHYQAGSINRVVLLTDGAANLGDVDPAALKQKVETHRKQGIALDCFGIGWEGYNDDLLEQLSRNGDGRYGFLNSPEEAASEFAGQLAGALRVAASDVKVQVEFNPRRVTAYRQIGYAKHQLTKEQFRDNTVDAAEIGAAESGNALYVVEVNPRGEGDLATVRVRFKVPGTSDYREHAWQVPFNCAAPPFEQGSAALRLAGSASAFSESLAGSPFAADVTSDALLGYLNGVPAVYGADPRPQRLEWMIRQAKSISGR